MRDDLLDADACVDWAKTQIPLLQKTVESWEKGRGYQVIIEPDADGVYKIFAYSLGPLGPTYNAAVGAIINSLRSSLDLLAAALARRNCVVPKTKTYFPIVENRRRLLNRLKVIEREKWLSKSEIATIKDIKPYRGGDKAVWPLAKLDNLRKHERLIAVSAIIPADLNAGIRTVRFEEKADLGPVPFGMSADEAERNTNLTLQVTLDEPTLGLAEAPVIPTLYGFAARCREIIKLFEVP